jgi:flavin reductase (DIM6/NTAB) family NADH-FMN oxidoreductase RutF
MEFAAASSVLSLLDREVWLVTAASGLRRGGLVATSVSEASIVPELPRVLVGLARQHYTWELVETAGVFGLNLLGQEHVPWVWRFGLESGRDRDKLEDMAVHTGRTGSPLLAEALGWLDCRVEARLETGDRTVYLAEVVDGACPRPAPPLTVKRLLALASPKHLQELKSQLVRDAAVDAAAIRAWRSRSE